ncbi:hypothetical protein HA402_003830 [Bradysia odoriphaga]|nr:hypothetical protein HA402_003830 [Bradysia odoriphaga]
MYPNHQQAPYPSNPGYPTQSGYSSQPPYPNSAPYPQQSSMPFGAGFPPMPPSQGNSYPSMPPSQANSYPPMPPTQDNSYPPMPPSQANSYPTLPPAHHGGAYPPSQQSYPPSQPGFQSNYPPAQSTAMPSYPSASQSIYPTPSSTNNVYPSQTQYPPPSNQSFAPSQGYPSLQNSGFQAPSQHIAATHMAACFSEMQSHKRENHSKGNPTVVPAQNFDPADDAKALRKAMKGFGTDEDALIDVLCRRSNEQRIMILRSYKTNFGKDLVEDIKSETSGNFEKLLVALLTPIVDYYVKELHDAMSGLGTDEDVLIEILCSMTNYEIHTIKNAYERLYGKNLESELMSETSGHFKRLLVALCTANRDESGSTDIDAARRDATELLRAGELRVGTDESTFNMILCQRNFAQIRLICNEYEKISGHSLEKAINNEFSGDIMDGLVAILQCTSNKSEFFASRLHKSMAGLGTNDNQLIRLIVTRCEIDLNDIKAAFEQKYGKSLRSWIKGDTSGHYKHALYVLIGEQRSS